MAITPSGTPGVYTSDDATPSGDAGVYTMTGGQESDAGVFTLPVGALTAYPDFGPVPRVLVSVTGLADGTQTVTVLRTSDGREMEVRRGVNLFAVGGASVMDYEVPPGVSSYRAEQFDANGVPLGFLALGTVTMPDFTCIHQPLSPALAVASPRILMDSVNDLSHPSPGSVVWPEGATVGRIIGGQRRGLTGARMHVRLRTTDEMDTFSAMFGGYGQDFPSVLCIRTPPGKLRIPRVFFAGCLDPHEVITGVNAVLTYDMTVDEVAPPYPGLILPLLRRMDIDAAYPTRAERAAAYSTRLARDTDFSLAGTAG